MMNAGHLFSSRYGRSRSLGSGTLDSRAEITRYLWKNWANCPVSNGFELTTRLPENG